MQKKDPNILIIDDDKRTQEAYKNMFLSHGLSAVHAMTAKEGLKVLEDSKIDIILLDILMPKMDGIEFLEKVKADKKLKKIPVLVTSNSVKDEHIEKTKELGAKEYLVKSNTSIEELVKKVKEHLKN